MTETGSRACSTSLAPNGREHWPPSQQRIQSALGNEGPLIDLNLRWRQPMAVHRRHALVVSCLLAFSLLSDVTASASTRSFAAVKPRGGYAAFPDICRLHNGDLFCVFYSGYGHVSTPSAKWPKGGRHHGGSLVRQRPDLEPARRDRRHELRRPRLFGGLSERRNAPAQLVHASTGSAGQGAVADHDGPFPRPGETWSPPAKIDLQSPYLFACFLAGPRIVRMAR